MPNVRIPELHDGQREILANAKRFNLVSCGRRFGKTTLGVYLLLTEAASRRTSVAWCAPTYKLLLEVFRDVTNRLGDAAASVNKSEHRIELINGSIIEFWTLDRGDPARGRSYSLIILDEAALVSNLGAIWQYALRPTLADTLGKAYFLTTPKRGAFKTLWEDVANGDDWARYTAPTWNNPYIPKEEIEAMRLGLSSAAFSQEIAAEFPPEDGAVFRNVRPGYITAKLGDAVAFGIDWAGSGDGDYTVIVGISLDGQVVYLDRFSGVPYDLQIKRVLAALTLWRPINVLAESNGLGGPLVEALGKLYPVKPFATSASSKAKIIENLAYSLEVGKVTLPDNQELLDELRIFSNNRGKYGAPVGYHDDMVMALAIALEAASANTSFQVYTF